MPPSPISVREPIDANVTSSAHHQSTTDVRLQVNRTQLRILGGVRAHMQRPRPVDLVIVFRVRWQLVYVVEHNIFTAHRESLDRPEVEKKTLVEQAALRLLRHHKPELRVPSGLEPISHVIEESIELPGTIEAI